VIRLIQFRPLFDHAILPNNWPSHDVIDIDHYAQLEALSRRFISHLSWYLNGVGHPDCEDFNGLILSAKREEAKADIAFRACQFKEHITGSTFLNSTPEKLKVSGIITHHFPKLDCNALPSSSL
jgi:hypothetical protein